MSAGPVKSLLDQLPVLDPQVALDLARESHKSQGLAAAIKLLASSGADLRASKFDANVVATAAMGMGSLALVFDMLADITRCGMAAALEILAEMPEGPALIAKLDAEMAAVRRSRSIRLPESGRIH